ncbi:hypothetical protein VTJ83DRAFT_3722 [Remersonia thermophila]|uniref:CFEM domain-containing protein n=1 Tax=Remersonia thermophila TaxID=72144 RepID=A0ABR4DEV4_9PEZI
MKSLVLLVAAAGAAMAQNFEGQPACATGCLISAISAAGCAPDDIGCQCGPTQSVIAVSVAPCLISACAASDLIQAQSAGEAQCRKYSATLASTDATTTPGTAATTTTTATTTTGPEATGATAATAATTSSSTGAAAAVTPAVVGAGAALLGMLGAAGAL